MANVELKRTICSIFFRPLDAQRNYKKYDDSTGYSQHFHLDACKPGEFKTIEVWKSFQRVYIGDGRYNDIPVYADSQGNSTGLAADLVAEWSDNVLGGAGNSRPGVFVCLGDEPTPAELKAAEESQTRWCNWLCMLAEEDWVNGRKTAITSLQRDAAMWLGRTDYQWVTEQQGPSRLKQCPVCAKDVPATALKCSMCGSIVDFDGYMAYLEKSEKLQSKLKEMGISLDAPMPPKPVPPPLTPGQPKRAA